jgi:hypothetical protein
LSLTVIVATPARESTGCQPNRSLAAQQSVGGRVDFAVGRGYDRREYQPFGVSFEDNQAIFAEGMEIVRRLWAAEAPVLYQGKILLPQS